MQLDKIGENNTKNVCAAYLSAVGFRLGRDYSPKARRKRRKYLLDYTVVVGNALQR